MLEFAPDPKKTKAAEDQARDGRHLEVDFPEKYPHAPVDGGIATAYLRGKLSTLDGIKFEPWSPPKPPNSPKQATPPVWMCAGPKP